MPTPVGPCRHCHTRLAWRGRRLCGTCYMDLKVRQATPMLDPHRIGKHEDEEEDKGIPPDGTLWCVGRGCLTAVAVSKEFLAFCQKIKVDWSLCEGCKRKVVKYRHDEDDDPENMLNSTSCPLFAAFPRRL
jgi:hypothetical protein